MKMPHNRAPAPIYSGSPVSPGALHSLAARLRRVSAMKSMVRRVRQWRATAIDRWLNVSTPYPDGGEYKVATRHGDAVPNEPLDYLLLRRFMKPLNLSPDDVMYDVGCGMGRVLCLFARRAIRKCIGIEFDPQLARIAGDNARRLRGRKADIEIRCDDAADADYHNGTIYWFFNPFGTRTLHAVMKRIEHSVAHRSRSIRIVYVNPVHQAVMREFAWLRPTGFVQEPIFGRFGASYWASVGKPRSRLLQPAIPELHPPTGAWDELLTSLSADAAVPASVSFDDYRP